MINFCLKFKESFVGICDLLQQSYKDVCVDWAFMHLPPRKHLLPKNSTLRCTCNTRLSFLHHPHLPYLLPKILPTSVFHFSHTYLHTHIHFIRLTVYNFCAVDLSTHFQSKIELIGLFFYIFYPKKKIKFIINETRRSNCNCHSMVGNSQNNTKKSFFVSILNNKTINEKKLC
jgi:hypothetical protein